MQPFSSLFVLAVQLLHVSASSLLKQACINNDCSAKRITISNPPVNLFDSNLIQQLNIFMNGLQNDNQTKVVVFSSATPDFWAASIDLNLLSAVGIPGTNTS